MSRADGEDRLEVARAASQFQLSVERYPPKGPFTALQLDSRLLTHAARTAKAQGRFKSYVIEQWIRTGIEACAAQGLCSPLPSETVEVVKQEGDHEDGTTI